MYIMIYIKFNSNIVYIKRHSWIQITITFCVYYNVCVHTQWHKILLHIDILVN